MSTVSGTCTVQFHSDWIVGTGHGAAGGIDALSRRDPDGLPYVPAKTLTGVLRDAAERCAAVLDLPHEGEQPWSAWVTWLFGGQPNQGERPQPARLSVRPARLPAPVREILVSDPDLARATTFVKPGVMIDDRSGRARDDFLRLEERAIAGLRCVAPVELSLDGVPEDVTAPIDLLVLATAEVNRIGGDRRRGAGRCHLELQLEGIATTVETALEQIDRLDRTASLRAIAASTSTSTGSPAPTRTAPRDEQDDENDMTTYHVHLRTTTPVLVPEQVTGNLITSASEIPGRVLLPALLTALGQPADLAAAARAGKVVVTSATPAVAGKRSLAVPAVLAGPKARSLYGEVELVNTLHRDPPAGSRPVRTGHVVLGPPGGGSAPLRLPARQSAAHAVIDDDRQRPTSEIGGLYSVVALPAGLELLAEVRGPATLLSKLTELDGTRLRVGASKKDDYGAVEVTAVEEATDHGDIQPAFRQLDDGVELVVWLTSPLLLRDERLRPTTSLEVIAAELSRRLGVEVSVPAEGGFAGGRATRVDGWRARWDLPHATLAGLDAGTVLRFRADAAPAKVALDRLHRLGVGERTAEGFGQVVVGHPALVEQDNITVTVESSDATNRARSPAPSTDQLDPDDRHLLVQIAQVALRNRISGQAAMHATELAALLPTATRTQLAHVRNTARALTGGERARTDALERLRSFQLGGLLDELLTQPDAEIWNHLHLDVADAPWRDAAEACWPLALQTALGTAVRAASTDIKAGAR